VYQFGYTSSAVESYQEELRHFETRCEPRHPGRVDLVRSGPQCRAV